MRDLLFPSMWTLNLRDKQDIYLTEKFKRQHYSFYKPNRLSLQAINFQLFERLNSILKRPLVDLGSLPDQYFLSSKLSKYLFRNEFGKLRALVFIYSDTMLERTYHLSETISLFHEFFPKFFEVLSIHPRSVIRCYLLEQAPFSDIKIPADNGYWVGVSHHILVPLLPYSFRSIKLRIGGKETSLNHLSVIELNNKLSYNLVNEGSLHMLYFVFDFVEPHVFEELSIVSVVADSKINEDSLPLLFKSRTQLQVHIPSQP